MEFHYYDSLLSPLYLSVQLSEYSIGAYCTEELALLTDDAEYPLIRRLNFVADGINSSLQTNPSNVQQVKTSPLGVSNCSLLLPIYVVGVLQNKLTCRLPMGV